MDPPSSVRSRLGTLARSIASGFRRGSLPGGLPRRCGARRRAPAPAASRAAARPPGRSGPPGTPAWRGAGPSAPRSARGSARAGCGGAGGRRGGGGLTPAAGAAGIELPERVQQRRALLVGEIGLGRQAARPAPAARCRRARRVPCAGQRRRQQPGSERHVVVAAGLGGGHRLARPRRGRRPARPWRRRASASAEQRRGLGVRLLERAGRGRPRASAGLAPSRRPAGGHGDAAEAGDRTPARLRRHRARRRGRAPGGSGDGRRRRRPSPGRARRRCPRSRRARAGSRCARRPRRPSAEPGRPSARTRRGSACTPARSPLACTTPTEVAGRRGHPGATAAARPARRRVSPPYQRTRPERLAGSAGADAIATRAGLRELLLGGRPAHRRSRRAGSA